MRTTIFLAVLVTACATPGANRNVRSSQSTPAASHASTVAADDLIRGDYAGALAAADRGLRGHPDDPWLLYNKGAALAGLGRVDEALATLHAAENNFRDVHDQSLAAYRRALTLEMAGRCGEASTEYSRYAVLVRETEPWLADTALAHLRFCVSPSPQEMAERAERAQLSANAADETRRRAEDASTRSVTALARGDYATALSAAEAGLQIAPDDPWLLYNRGTALAGLGHTDESLEVLRGAEHRFNPDNLHGRSVATYRRAIALELAGRCQEEKTELEHYASLAGEKDPQLAEHVQAHLRFCQLASKHPVF